MPKFHNPPPVHPNVAGNEFMRTEDAKKLLGRAGFKIWVKLLHNREYNGMFQSYVTNEGIAKLTGYALRTVEDAMRRLRKVGLVVRTQHSFTTRQLDHRGSYKDFQVFRRRVFGDWREGQIAFPRRIADAIRALPTHGGARKGAGRPGPKRIKYVGESLSSTWVKERREKRDLSSKEERRRLPPQVVTLSKRKEEKVIPPYPSAELLKIPKTPDPPHLPEQIDDVKDALFLAKAYRGAYESRYGKKSWWLARGDIEKSKHFPMLVKAASVFRELGFAPASWCAWVMDFWKQYIVDSDGKSPKRRDPPPGLVFSEKLIREKRGHFGRDGLSYLGGTRMFPKSWTDLFRRYNGMMWTFRVKQPKTQLEVAHIVEEWFPGGWRSHYRRCRDEAQNDKARLQRMLQRGEWLWP